VTNYLASVNAEKFESEKTVKGKRARKADANGKAGKGKRNK
jgi:hypothetical protein